MDVGAPSNFVRILDLFQHSHKGISAKMKGYRYNDDEIKTVIDRVYGESGYLCDPHGACAYQALTEYLAMDQLGVFLETAHPAKFTETVEDIIGKGKVVLPEKLAAFMKGEKQSVGLSKEYQDFKSFLLR